ncbi:MAG TPA: hypothetical protein VF725_04880 [Ktedonobacterales bacterium]
MREATPFAASDSTPGAGDDVWSGARAGATPLLLTLLVGAVMAGLTTLARIVATPLGFLAWQPIAIVIWVVGLLLTATVYAIAMTRAWRQARGWQAAGMARRAAGAWWTLGVVALLTVLPVILALALPQHPAP